MVSKRGPFCLLHILLAWILSSFPKSYLFKQTVQGSFVSAVVWLILALLVAIVVRITFLTIVLQTIFTFTFFYAFACQEHQAFGTMWICKSDKN
jgi:fatty acid desaturase